jgi:hypothetical protein
MAMIAMDEERLKALLKSALGEALEEHRDMVRNLCLTISASSWSARKNP